MKLRALLSGLSLLTLTAFLPRAFQGQTPAPHQDPYLTAHEWGTFTSIAGRDGRAIEWLPLTGSTDLPSFVEHFSGAQFKGGLLGTVRMETPVLYFYTNRESTISVHVSFSKGLITEWYPHASHVYPVAAVAPKYANFSDWSLYQNHPDGSISWDAVALKPKSFAELPSEQHENHYYAARQTASTPLEIKAPHGAQIEKFLFYRGVSTFTVPLLATVQADGSLLAENLADATIPAMLLFERRGEKLGFRVVQSPASGSSLAPPELSGDINALKRTLVDILVAEGLFQDEAEAMFETWRDSWFEEGSRLLYIVPRPFVDSILALTIQPVPAKTVRVFVGRLELVTPATKMAIERAVETNDRTTLSRFGRFLTPILQNMIVGEKNPKTKAKLEECLNSSYALSARSN